MAETIVQQPGATSVQHSFSELPAADVNRSTFDRSRGWKSTMPEAGILYPCFVDEYLPGDSMSVRSTAFVRLATPLKPIMDTLHVQMHWFSVANRLVWPEFVNMMGERTSPTMDPEDFTVPMVQFDAAGEADTVADYFGLPVGQPGSMRVSALPFRAYKLIWSEWFRDQNFDPEYDIENESSYIELRSVRRRYKSKDYYTSTLPWAQKGDEVVIPLADEGYVYGEGVADGKIVAIRDKDSDLADWTMTANDAFAGRVDFADGVPGIGDKAYLYVDLANATAVSINELRTAFQIQKLLERDARSGTRYIETVLAHFAVQGDDRRQFRPEFLGSGSAVMNISPVANTTGTAEQPQGELSAVGTGLCRSSWTKAFTEHGIVIGMISIKSELTYQNGIERMWSRETRYDFYWPSFQHLGEQAVLNKEIFFSGNAQVDNAVFGYQERWSEYRYAQSKVCGKFRSSDPESLDVWHLAQDITDTPTLSTLFLLDIPPVDRVIAVPSEPHFLADVWHEVKHTRPMPVYSIPGYIDHF